MSSANDLPLVSIVTPSLDRAAYIGDVILSIAGQSYPRVEHIVVDGGSTDGTLDVLRKLEKSYDFGWISESDTGMYNAINKGLAMSRGDILAYLNTDDLYLPWTVEVAVRGLLDDPKAALVYGDMAILDEKSGGAALALYPLFDIGLLGRSAFLGQPTVFFRRSAFEKVGRFDESLQFVADCDYWLRVGTRFPIRKVDEIMAVQRDHPETLRASQRSALREELRVVRSRYESMLGIKSRLRRVADRLHLFIDRRYRLMRFLKATNRYRRDPGYQGPWYRFLSEDVGITVSRAHVLAGLIPLAGRSMLFQMARLRSVDFLKR